MFAGPPPETVCDTDIQNSVAISVGQNVNEVILMSHYYIFGCAAGFLDFARNDRKITAPAIQQRFSQ